MVFLGFGRYARADRIYGLQPITGENRGGRRARKLLESSARPAEPSKLF